MTYKQLEASREARLWLTQIIAPVALGVALVMSNPERREVITNKLKGCKNKITSKFQKKS